MIPIVEAMRVRWSGKYLRGIGIHSGPMCQEQGKVAAVSSTHAFVEWDSRPRFFVPVKKNRLHPAGVPEAD